jgi:hypothetical protein
VRPLLVFVVVIVCATLSPARAQSAWGDLGSYLTTACSVAGGGVGVPLPGVGTIPIGGISNLDWLCTIKSMYNFVDGNILNGDWKQFGLDVVGQWATDLATYLVGSSGVGSVAGWINNANDAMRDTYREFRRKLTRMFRDALATKPRSTNAGLPITTAGGLADEFERTSPIIRSVADANRIAQTAQKFDQLDRGFRAAKITTEGQEAIDKALNPAVQRAAQIIGSPVADGEADSYAKKAATANSTREVMVTQVEATASLMKQQAVMNSAILSLLAEIARQGVMTNNTLVSEHGDAQAAVESNFDSLKAGLEDLAQQSLDEARQTANSVQSVQGVAEMLFDSGAINATDWGGMAP